MKEIVFPETPWSELPKWRRDLMIEYLQTVMTRVLSGEERGDIGTLREAVRILTMASHPGETFRLGGVEAVVTAT